MAPGQFVGKGATTRSDIYALGLTLYETCVAAAKNVEIASARFPFSEMRKPFSDRGKLTASSCGAIKVTSGATKVVCEVAAVNDEVTAMTCGGAANIAEVFAASCEIFRATSGKTGTACNDNRASSKNLKKTQATQVLPRPA
jgi:hypothetical protein